MSKAVDIETLEKIKHQELLQHINALLVTVSGEMFIKHLFESFGVMELPHPLCKGEDLIERVAFYRTGQSIYKLISQANPYMAGTILAQLEKERNHVYENDTNTETE